MEVQAWTEKISIPTYQGNPKKIRCFSRSGCTREAAAWFIPTR